MPEYIVFVMPRTSRTMTQSRSTSRNGILTRPWPPRTVTASAVGRRASSTTARRSCRGVLAA